MESREESRKRMAREEEEEEKEELEEEEEEDEEDEDDDEEEDEEGAGEKQKPKLIDILRQETRGKLKLAQPFRAHSEDITELEYDFCTLTSEEMMEALDSAPFFNIFGINNNQAMALFCATAAKCAPKVREDGRIYRLYDAKDIKRGLGAIDGIKAVQLAKLFYNASSQVGGNNISKE